jgi:septal ring factor EnvC (AmiA/AmiB activator)
MSETPVPETLETIAAKIDALSKSNDERFGKIDQHFAQVDRQFAQVDRQFDETKAQLGVKIEAVDTKVKQVYDEVIAMRAETTRNAKEHEAFTKRLDSHDLRILALEKPGPAKP